MSFGNTMFQIQSLHQSSRPAANVPNLFFHQSSLSATNFPRYCPIVQPYSTPVCTNIFIIFFFRHYDLVCYYYMYSSLSFYFILISTFFPRVIMSNFYCHLFSLHFPPIISISRLFFISHIYTIILCEYLFL